MKIDTEYHIILTNYDLSINGCMQPVLMLNNLREGKTYMLSEFFQSLNQQTIQLTINNLITERYYGFVGKIVVDSFIYVAEFNNKTMFDIDNILMIGDVDMTDWFSHNVGQGMLIKVEKWQME